MRTPASSYDSRFDSIVPCGTVVTSLRGVAGLQAQSVAGRFPVRSIGVPAQSGAQCEETVVSRPAPYAISQVPSADMPPVRLRLRGSRYLSTAVRGD